MKEKGKPEYKTNVTYIIILYIDVFQYKVY